jgi:HEAT repeat protein
MIPETIDEQYIRDLLYRLRGAYELRETVRLAVDELRTLERSNLYLILHNIIAQPDTLLQRLALEAIVWVDKVEAVHQLLPYLKHPSSDLRYIAVYLLGDCGNASAIDPLINIAQADIEPGIRGGAVFSLGKIGTPAILDFLEDIYTTDDGVDLQGHPVKEAAQTAIERIKLSYNLP